MCTLSEHVPLTLLHSEWPKLYRVLAILSAIGLIWKIWYVVVHYMNQLTKSSHQGSLLGGDSYEFINKVTLGSPLRELERQQGNSNEGHGTWARMKGWMTCNFTSFSTVFNSYQDDVWMIMKGFVQWNPINSWTVGFKWAKTWQSQHVHPGKTQISLGCVNGGSLDP